MMTPQIPPPVSDLPYRFNALHAHVALLRDICIMMATESCSQIVTESISREAWHGLFLLGEEATNQIEEIQTSLFSPTRKVTV